MTTNLLTQPHDGLAAELFDALRYVSADGEGVTRASYSAAEEAAHLLIANTAERFGLDVRTDEALNTWIELPGTDPELPAIVMGSHLDSVRRGGNFDGAAGVVAGLVTLLRLREGPSLRRNVRTVAFRGEESAWFGTCYIGSRALVGALSADMLAASAREPRRTLRQAMAEAGADLGPIDAAKPLVDPSSIKLYLELHIEQGPALIAADIPVGAVTGIRGNRRYSNITWAGRAGHSGAVPRELRADAVLGAACWLAELDDLWTKAEGEGHDVVITAGVLTTDPMDHGVTRIPDVVQTSLDVRSLRPETLEEIGDKAEAVAERIANDRGLTVDFGDRVDTPPATIDADMANTVLNAATSAGHRAMLMPSGAGHDAAALGEAGIPIGMVFVRNANGSHNPYEAMDLDDFAAGVDTLTFVAGGAAS